MSVQKQIHFYCFYQPCENVFVPDFLFLQAASEMTLACSVRTVNRRLSAITETVIWDVVQGVPQSPDTISIRFPTSFCQQFRYCFTFVHLSQILFFNPCYCLFFNTLSICVQMLFGKGGQEVQRFQLFESSLFGEKDLLFRDATDRLNVLPDDMDISQVVGLDYMALLKSLRHEGADHRWCVVVHFYTENSAAVLFLSLLFEAD